MINYTRKAWQKKEHSKAPIPFLHLYKKEMFHPVYIVIGNTTYSHLNMIS